MRCIRLLGPLDLAKQKIFTKETFYARNFLPVFNCSDRRVSQAN